MGLELRMSQKLELSTKQKIELRQGARLEMIQQIKLQISALLFEIGIDSEGSTERVLNLVIKTFIENLKATESEPTEGEPRQSDILEQHFAQNKNIFYEMLSKNNAQYVLRGKSLVALFKSLLQLSLIEFDNKRTTLGIIENALQNPTENKKEIEKNRKNIQELQEKRKPILDQIIKTEELLKITPETDSATRSELEQKLKELQIQKAETIDPGIFVQALTELQEAQNIAETLLQDVAPSFLPLLKELFSTQVEGKSLLKEFIIDRNVMDALIKDMDVPQKIVGKIRERLNEESTPSRREAYNRTKKVPESLKNMITNTVGQLILVSLGIIDEEIFTLRKGEKMSTENATAFQRSTGLSFENTLKKYNLQGHKGFVFYRYSVLNQRPTQETDNAIREFITKTVRENQTEILEKMGLERIFDDLIDEVEDDEDREATVDNKISELFHEEFIRYLTDEIKNKYLKELQANGLKKT